MVLTTKGVATGILWIEARDVAKHPIYNAQDSPLTRRNYVAPNINSVEVENPGLR